MNNYKILNSDANQIVKLLNELGYTWTPSTNDSETSLLKAYWIITESSGEIVYSSTESFVDEDFYKEISLAQINDLVAQSKNEQGLISGADALRALADGKEVEYLGETKTWFSLNEETSAWSLTEVLNATDLKEGTSFKFRLKPHTITLSLEIPAPFEPKAGDMVWCLTEFSPSGYEARTAYEPDDFFSNLGYWRTEEEIKQVVAALRGEIKA